ncbi:MAG: gliding motility-associated C-terminal domain-containing protein [Prevotella sp.]|nr:gliding motility-associated C-terminal domain-containing protein [Prevotella sp.]
MRRFSMLLLLMAIGTLLPWTVSHAQTTDPFVTAMGYYTDSEGEQQESNSIDDGEAPLTVSFRANPEDMGIWTPSFEWHFRKVGVDGDLFVRYEENTEYTFTESGTYNVVLKTFLHSDEFESELDSQTVTVVIAESKLVFPNAFSPNGDGKNDIYRAKEYKSIVSFRAIILNRWGQKLYEWNDPAEGWDGKHNGHDVKQGVYFALVEAKGADGKDYKIRKDVNLLRGFTSKEGNSTTTNE